MTTKNMKIAAETLAAPEVAETITAISDTKPVKSGKVIDLYAKMTSDLTERARRKVELLGDTKQRLSHAFDLYGEGDDKAKEATEIADKASVKLYQARADGLATAEEISAILGDVFGVKPKKDGTPGKTPDGQGEAIRKRVVRAANAADFVRYQSHEGSDAYNGPDGGSFFEGLTLDSQDEAGNTIGSTLHELENGSIGIWTAYDRFAAVKKAASERAEMAFDPKRIAKLVQDLSKPEALDKVQGNPALIVIYGELRETINVLLTVSESQAA